MEWIVAFWIGAGAGFALGNYRGRNPDRFARKVRDLVDRVRGKRRTPAEPGQD